MIFNELEYAETMLTKGFLQQKYLTELKLLAKYYNKKDRLKTEEVKQKLKEFCKKYLPKYNEVIHLDLISKATHYGVQKKNVLVVIPPIVITKNELEKIKGLDNIKLEKLAFTALVLSKVNKCKNGRNKKNKGKENKNWYYVNNLKELYKYSNLNLNKQKKEEFLKQLTESKLFDLTIFCSLKVNFVDETSVVKIKLEHFNNFVLEYAKYVGENIIYCEGGCNTPISPTNNRQKYCKSCWEDRQRALWRENKRMHRNVQV